MLLSMQSPVALLLLLIPTALIGSASSGCNDPCNGGCGHCQQSVEAYCAGGEDCTFSGSYQCVDDWAYRSTETGCGHLRTEVEGPEGEIWERIYDAATEELVFIRELPGADADLCSSSLTVGTRPECSEWVDVCDDEQGLGGAAGAGP